MKRNLSIILLTGAVWGITETTAGHLLHVLAWGFGWLFWFPAAFFFLNLVYRITGHTYSMLFTALITTAIKMIDIFYTPRIDYVINPAVSILLEGLAAYAVYRILLIRNPEIKQKPELSPVSIASIGILWRVFYVCYLLFLPESFITISCLRGTVPLVSFLFLETAANTLLLSLCVYAADKLTAHNSPLRRISLSIRSILPKKGILIPVISVLVLAAAILLQIKL